MTVSRAWLGGGWPTCVVGIVAIALGCHHRTTFEELQIQSTVAVFPDVREGGVQLSCALFFLNNGDGVQARITITNGSSAPIHVLTADSLMGMTEVPGGGFVVANGSDELIQEASRYPNVLSGCMKEVPSGASATQVLWIEQEPADGVEQSPERLGCAGRWWDHASDFGTVPPHALSTQGLWICPDHLGHSFICPPPGEQPVDP